MAVPLTIRRILSIQPLNLSVFHPIALKMIHLLTYQNFSIEELENTANGDQVLTGQILKMANSTDYSGRVKVETIREGLIRLGAHHVSNLAMTASQAALHISKNSFINDALQKLWLHSHACALGCRWVALNSGYGNIAEQAYLAGLMHDVGKLHILKSLERLFDAGMALAAMKHDMLLEIFSELHVHHGLRIMDHWNMPLVYVNAVSKHHDAEVSSDYTILAIVRLVNAITRRCGLSFSSQPAQPLSEITENSRLRLNNDQLAELENVIENSKNIGV